MAQELLLLEDAQLSWTMPIAPPEATAQGAPAAKGKPAPR
jgi:hypothetical protein